MKACEKTRKASKFIALLALAAATVFCVAFFGGCSDDRKPYLSVDKISIEVGERRDILPYVYFPPSADRDIELYCSDECVSVNGTYITGEEVGSANVVIEVSGIKSTLTVEVVLARSEGLIIVNDGNTEQTVGAGVSALPITFAAYDAVSDPVVAEWSVNGETFVGETFVFTPPDRGEFTIRAYANGSSSECAVRIYRPTEVTAEFFGELEQTGNFSAVSFFATEIFDPHNPRSVFVWKVNGDEKSRSARFDFIPDRSGEFKITLTVNGACVDIDGSETIVVNAKDRAPTGNVEFDDTDGVYVTWIDGEHIVRATVISPNGTRKNLDRSDAQYSYLFEKGRLEVTDLVEVCAEEPAEYRIILVAENSCEITFNQYPVAAQSFLDEKIYARNSFISSEYDCARWIEELYVTGAEFGRAYIGRAAGDVGRTISDKATELGLTATVTIADDIVSVRFGKYIMSPREYASTETTRMYSTMPHIDYGAHSRAEDYVFALDRATESVEVSSSEQLLYAAKYGLRPVCKPDSTAELIYGSAKHRLNYIIGSSYCDEQKVHAVYDYLQWITLAAAHPTIDDSSRFLESVFGSRDIEQDSGRAVAAVTGEGTAKAFLLLCGIEGIDCIIQCMETSDGGSYYWNKVKLNGLWYNVDVYGGKVTSSELGISRLSTLNSHRAFLIDDESARKFGLRPYGGEFAAVDASMTYYTDNKSGADGENIGFYISSGDDGEYGYVRAAIFFALDSAPVGTVGFPVTGGEQLYSITTVGAEFFIADELTADGIENVYALIERAVSEYVEERYGSLSSDNGVILYRAGNNLHVVVTPPRTQAEE